MKILLINPHAPKLVKCKDRSIPLGLLYLGTALQKKGFSVKLVDVNNDVFGFAEKELDDYFQKKFWKRIGDFKPDFVGVGCPFTIRFKQTLQLCKLIKKKYPAVPIALGGIHPTTFPKEILQEYKFIDYIVLGEGEVSFPLLIEAHSSDKGELKKIGGIAFRAKGKVVVNAKTSFIADLDNLHFPAYDLIDLRDYYFDTAKWHNPRNLPIGVPMPIVSSRGCPNRCTFCAMYLMHGRVYRARSAKNVVDEIEWLYNKYGQRYFSFMDDNLTFSRERTMAIASEIIGRGLQIQFDTPNGISLRTLDKELIDSLVKAGMVRTCIAIESGSEFIRNEIMKKGLPEQKIFDFFDAIKEHSQLQVKAFFMIGYPQETKETLDETFRMLQRLPLKQVAIFFVVPFPATELFEYCRKNKLLNLPMNKLHNLATFSNYNDSDRPFIKPYNLEISDLVAFRKKAYALVENRRLSECNVVPAIEICKRVERNG